MRRRAPDLASVVAGLVLLGLGAVLLADAAGAIALSFEALGPLVCGSIGAVLLALGLTRED